jgi:hypothetical protein
MMALFNNFPISHLCIETYIILNVIDVPGSKSIWLHDNCCSVQAWAAVKYATLFVIGTELYVLHANRD